MYDNASGEVLEAGVETIPRDAKTRADLGLEARVAELQTKVDNLEVALTSNRRIGAAIGILMSRHKITYEDGFALLRQASQHSQTKLRDVAEKVLRMGTLELPQGVEDVAAVSAAVCSTAET
jgi:hypothetical protein